VQWKHEPVIGAVFGPVSFLRCASISFCSVILQKENSALRQSAQAIEAFITVCTINMSHSFV
jgi:hypothetical protein